jgi:hypothetical protein
VTALADPPAAGEPVAGAAPPKPTEEWKVDSIGRQYADMGKGSGLRGPVFRQGEETVEEGRERRRQAAERPRDKRPRAKTKRPPMPEAPKKVDLKELERTIAEALKAPAIICATFGDQWAADHFTTSGPYLARNLIVASEHNPWLRRKLEEAATGQDAMMIMVSMVGVGGALFAYAIPPIIWWFNLPVSDKARDMFGIPAQRKPEYAATKSPPGAVEPEPEVSQPAAFQAA